MRWTLLLFGPLGLLVGCAPGVSGGDDDDSNAPNDDDSGDDDDASTCDVYGLEPGDCPPEFTLPSTAGGQVALGDFQGQRIIVLGTSNW